MQNFRGKVAVITGGASGIGLGLARKAASEGMRLVLADIEQGALAAAAAELRAGGAEVLPLRTDVSQLADVEALAQQAFAHFGGVHLLCNNAGVGSSVGGSVLTGTIANWQWLLGVNLWGVIHGVHVFAPLLLEQNEPAHIVNTASVAGLIAGHLGIYTVSKHAVVALSESLYEELARIGTPLQAHVLCPGTVATALTGARRNRPASIAQEPDERDIEIPGRREWLAGHSARIDAGMDPALVAEHVFAALREGRFYIYTHPWDDAHMAKIGQRCENLLAGSNPVVAPYDAG